ncbi:MAG: cytochrome b/b6 domain-containing protein [Phycisphaerales bacterium]|nr:cytochrome b/b6 domain-containing protein [Phycisphaerales bacterium]
MAPTLIWDLPTRLFHWTLAAGFAAAALIALALGEHSALFPYHAIIGLTLALMVALRAVWGLVGSRYARFGSFAFGPGAVVEYLRGTLLGGGKRHVGHNPGSAYAIFAMLALLAALAATGVMLGRGNEGVKEAHELCAYALLGVVGVHILGVLVHTLRHRENITAGMIHGRKLAEPGEGIGSARPLAAAAFLVITGAWAFGLVRGYDPATRAVRLPLSGVVIHVGEPGGDRAEPGPGGRRRGDDD